MAMNGWDELRSTLDAVSDNGRQAEMMRQVGNYYFQRDRFDAAIDAYSEAITMRPNVLVQLTNRAMCYCKKKEWEKVEEDCRRALQLVNSSVKARYMLGLALLGKENYEEGIKELEEALSIGRRAEPKDYIVEEIWQELSKAKYSHWQRDCANRSEQLLKLEEACVAALKQKHALEYFDTQGFIDLTSDSNLEELEALTRVFKKVADPDVPREIPDHLCCKITHDIYRDPIITPSGVTYERKALLEHLAKVGHFDPVTRMRIQPEQLTPNLAIKAAVQAFLNQHGWAYNVDETD